VVSSDAYYGPALAGLEFSKLSKSATLSEYRYLVLCVCIDPPRIYLRLFGLRVLKPVALIDFGTLFGTVLECHSECHSDPFGTQLTLAASLRLIR
jgi:hypothetical protein